MPYGNGHPSPAWMESESTIHAASKRYRERVPELIESHDGSLVLGSAVGGIIVSVEDRASGIVYYRCQGEQEPGATLPMDWNIVTTGVHPDHKFRIYLRIVRRATLSEVREMAQRCATGTPLTVVDGYWYEVQVD